MRQRTLDGETHIFPRLDAQGGYHVQYGCLTLNYTENYKQGHL